MVVLLADPPPARFAGRQVLRVGRKVVAQVPLPTGEVVVGDPLALPWRRLVDRVPPGTYPVEDIFLTSERRVDPYLMGTVLWIRREPPAAWRMALAHGEDIATLGRGKILCHWLDSGNSGFMDPRTAAVLCRRGRRVERVIDAWIDRIGPATPGELVIDRRRGHIASISGNELGDGPVASYWGLDASGEIVCLLSDFGNGP